MFQGILLVLYTGIAEEYLPQEVGLGSGFTCWRRLTPPAFRSPRNATACTKVPLTLRCALICRRRPAAVQRRHS